MKFYDFLRKNRLGSEDMPYYQRFFTDPAFTILIAGFVVFSFSVYSVAYNFGYNNLHTKKSRTQATENRKVLGEADQIDKDKAFLDPDVYEYSLKTILRQYLEARSRIIDNPDSTGISEFVKTAKQIQQSLLDMRVREYYKDVHLRVVLLIQKEIEYYQNIDKEEDGIDRYSDEWEEILNQYRWLN